MSSLIHWWELPKTTHFSLSEEFLQKLKKQRETLGFTQPKLAKLISVKEATIRSWEKSKRGDPTKIVYRSY